VLSRRALLAAAPLCLTACRKRAGAGGPLRFAFVTNNSSQFWNIAEKGVRKAERELGVKVEVFRPLKGDVADQQRFLEDIVVQGFDGVAISPINPDGMTPLLDQVASKMPVVCHDSDAARSKRTSYVGTNNVQAGRAAAVAALAALEQAKMERGKVALFVGRIDMQNAVDRQKGVSEVLGKHPRLELLPVFLDNTDRTKAKKNVEDALARHPDLVLTIGLWSYNGPALAGAIREAAREQKPLIVAFDEEEETLKGVEDGLVQATIVQKPFELGFRSIELLQAAKHGRAVPASVDTGILTVTRKNVAPFWSELREQLR
jgi:ribose transport system substrate-binding protein